MVEERGQMGASAPYYRARYYDITAGRLISEDPARFPGGVNFYTYVEDAPVGFVLHLVFSEAKLAAHRARGFADDQLRLDADGFRMTDIFRIRNSFQQGLRRDFAHSAQRMANCG